VWDLATGREHLTLTGHTLWVVSLAFSPDGRRLATAAAGGGHGSPSEGKLWDPDTGQEIYALFTYKGPWIPGCLAFSSDRRRLASAGAGELKAWNATPDE
jgi:WD40 repeat protein